MAAKTKTMRRTAAPQIHQERFLFTWSFLSLEPGPETQLRREA
jgi:hypothetical protein